MSKTYMNHKDFIKQAKSGLVPLVYAVSGKSGSGKTKMIKETFQCKENIIVLSVEKYTELFKLVAINNQESTSVMVKSLSMRFENVKYIIVEDVDLLRNKIATMEFTALLFNHLTKSGVVVIITGINLELRIKPLFQKLSPYCVIKL